VITRCVCRNWVAISVERHQFQQRGIRLHHTNVPCDIPFPRRFTSPAVTRHGCHLQRLRIFFFVIIVGGPFTCAACCHSVFKLDRLQQAALSCVSHEFARKNISKQLIANITKHLIANIIKHSIANGFSHFSLPHVTSSFSDMSLAKSGQRLRSLSCWNFPIS
jgi:hypothetical protein